MEHKKCSKCQVEKTKDQFDRYKRTGDGLQSQCKACMKVGPSPPPARNLTARSNVSRSTLDIVVAGVPALHHCLTGTAFSGLGAACRDVATAVPTASRSTLLGALRCVLPG